MLQCCSYSRALFIRRKIHDRCFEFSDISGEQDIVVRYTGNFGYFFLVVMNGKHPNLHTLVARPDSMLYENEVTETIY